MRAAAQGTQSGALQDVCALTATALTAVRAAVHLNLRKSQVGHTIKIKHFLKFHFFKNEKKKNVFLIARVVSSGTLSAGGGTVSAAEAIFVCPVPLPNWPLLRGGPHTTHNVLSTSRSLAYFPDCIVVPGNSVTLEPHLETHSRAREHSQCPQCRGTC